MDGLKTILERNRRALELRPGVGQGTATCTVRMAEGLVCDIEEGPWRLRTDMTAKSGGRNSAPNPGVYGRAALGSCLAIGYILTATEAGVPLDSLEVEVQADYDSRAMYGIGGVEPGYVEVRYTVRVSSPAPAADVQRVLDLADSRSDYLGVFTRPQQVRRQIQITHTGGSHGSATAA